MSGNVVGWVYEHYPVRCAADRTRKIVLAEVAEAANRDFENAHPGVRRICSDWHLGRSTVIGALGELVADGWLEITEDGRGRNATVYRVCRERVDRKGQEIDLSPDLSEDGKGPDSDGERARDSAQRARDSVCSLYPSSVSTQEPPAARGEDRADTPFLHAEFDLWWKEYPRRTDKKIAREKYLARRREGADAGDLLEAARQYASERDGEPDKWTKHAATFLSAADGPWAEALERSRAAPGPAFDPRDVDAQSRAREEALAARDAMTDEEREAAWAREMAQRAEGAG